MIFPWQMRQWQQLWQAKKENRLPHALLFAGMLGIGKTQFAESFTSALLCHANVSASACHHCHSCRLIAGKIHPNVLWITPEKAGQTIKIDQIRNMGEFIYQTSLQGDFHVVIINPANQMNANAANALLKMLEEPPQGALIILISDQSSRLPATIVSRCQRYIFSSPSFTQSLPWLQQQLEAGEIKSHVDTQGGVIDPALLLRLTHGAPLTAVQWIKTGFFSTRFTLLQNLFALAQQQADPIQLAANLSEMDISIFLDIMQTWVLDLLRLQFGLSAEEIINIDFAQQLIALQSKCQHLDPTFLSYLQQIYGQICTGINLNKQLLIENVLIKYKFSYIKNEG